MTQGPVTPGDPTKVAHLPDSNADPQKPGVPPVKTGDPNSKDPNKKSKGKSAKKAKITPVIWDENGSSPPDAETYIFEGGTNAVLFDIPGGLATLSASGTFEFWVSPHRAPSDVSASVLFELTGPRGVAYSVRLAGDRKTLSIWNSDTLSAHRLQADLTEARAYHLAFLFIQESTYIVIDGAINQIRLPVGRGSAPVDTLVLGASHDGGEVFDGKMARFRFWDRVLNPQDVVIQSRTLREPRLVDDLYGRLRFRVDLSQDTPELLPGPKTLSPDISWWHHYGSDYVRTHNRPSFADGKDTACTSSHLVQLHRASGGNAVKCGVGEIISDSSIDGEAASIYPVFSMDWVGSTPIPSPPALQATRGERVQYELPSEAYLTQISFSYSQQNSLRRIHGFRTSIRPGKSDDNAGVKTGPAQRYGDGITQNAMAKDRDWMTLTSSTRVNGLEYFHDDESIIGLRLLTSDGTSDWMGGELRQYKRRNVEVSEVKRIMVPDGATFKGFDTRMSLVTAPASGWGDEDATFRVDGVLMERQADVLYDITLLTDRSAIPPGLVVRTELGDETRFERIATNRYRSMRKVTPLSACDGKTCAYPELEFLKDDLFTIEGARHDFVPAAPHEIPNAQAEFNNTFVSLSKAVNLQANFTGYNLTTMDPLHLLDTGSGKHIFDMPNGDSKDYHDFNRIFVPNGLFYVPEFTGEYESHTADISSVEQFKTEHSKSVGVNLSSKLAPAAFNFSRAVQKGRQTILERQNSVTLGRTRAIFYSLVLDKPRMRLTKDFVERVYRLNDTKDFYEFISVFGTHYPVSVMYGGLGVLEVSYSRTARQELLEKKIDIKAEASALLSTQSKTRAGVSYASTTDNQKSYREEIGTQAENFYWVGGTHVSGGQQGWGVGTDGVVPIHVALRPIDELIAEPYFSDPEIINTLRSGLRKATIAYLEAAADASRRAGDQAQTVFVKFSADRLICTHGGDHGDEIDTTEGGTAGFRIRGTRNGFDWENNKVRTTGIAAADHKFSFKTGFEYTCGASNASDLLDLGNTPQADREWVVQYELAALATNQFDLMPSVGEVLFDGFQGRKGYNDAIPRFSLGRELCGGVCKIEDILGNKVTLEIPLEEYADTSDAINNSNQTLCIEVHDRDECAALRFDLTMEVLK